MLVSRVMTTRWKQWTCRTILELACAATTRRCRGRRRRRATHCLCLRNTVRDLILWWMHLLTQLCLLSLPSVPSTLLLDIKPRNRNTRRTTTPACPISSPAPRTAAWIGQKVLSKLSVTHGKSATMKTKYQARPSGPRWAEQYLITILMMGQPVRLAVIHTIYIKLIPFFHSQSQPSTISASAYIIPLLIDPLTFLLPYSDWEDDDDFVRELDERYEQEYRKQKEDADPARKHRAVIRKFSPVQYVGFLQASQNKICPANRSLIINLLRLAAQSDQAHANHFSRQSGPDSPSYHSCITYSIFGQSQDKFRSRPVCLRQYLSVVLLDCFQYHCSLGHSYRL